MGLGQVGGKLALSVRTWACDGCGVIHDRDVAAARVILSGAIPQALRESASGTRRKRGPVVRGGDRAPVRSSHGEPPSNVAETPALDEAA
jgi:transposase